LTRSATLALTGAGVVPPAVVGDVTCPDAIVGSAAAVADSAPPISRPRRVESMSLESSMRFLSFACR